MRKGVKREGFCSSFENVGRRGTFEEDLQRCSRVAGAIQETCSGDLLRRVAFLSVRSSGLLRWFCVTGAALRMTWLHSFVAGAALYTDGVEKSQNALVWGRQLCTQLSIFEGGLTELLRFWCCQIQKIEEVSQNCFVFDVVKLKHWGSLAELLRFRCCQL